jgi:rhamnosyltransferase
LTEGAVAKLVLAEHGLLKAGKKVAAVGPVFVDEKTWNQSCAIHHSLFRVHKIPLDISSAEPVETDNLIASGSIIRTATLDLVGIMRGDLFIDFVDTEWGLRARSRGYKSYCVPHCVMRHSIGDAAVRVFGKDVFVHGDARNYYRLRNAIFLLRIKTMGWGWRTYMAVRIPYYFLLFPWLSKNKMKNMRLVLKALMDGLTARLGHIAAEAE